MIQSLASADPWVELLLFVFVITIVTLEALWAFRYFNCQKPEITSWNKSVNSLMVVCESQPQWPLDKREIALSAAVEKALPLYSLTHSLQVKFKLPYSEHKQLFHLHSMSSHRPRSLITESFRLDKTLQNHGVQPVNPALPSPPLNHGSKYHIYMS